MKEMEVVAVNRMSCEGVIKSGHVTEPAGDKRIDVLVQTFKEGGIRILCPRMGPNSTCNSAKIMGRDSTPSCGYLIKVG